MSESVVGVVVEIVENLLTSHTREEDGEGEEEGVVQAPPIDPGLMWQSKNSDGMMRRFFLVS